MANATRVSAVRDQAKPRKLGRYELEECLGADAGIDTFRARVRGLAGFDRIFAVKCHRRGRGSAVNLNDPFIRAGKRTAALNDARIARVLDADVIDGVAIVVTEFVHGLDLDRFREWAQSSGVLATGTDEAALKWQKIVAYVGSEIAGALASIHALTTPLVHGGLSPRNVIATARGGIKVLDIGLRRSAQAAEDGTAPRAFAYAVPDEWMAEPSPKGDVRALGALLFELATGEPPPAGMGSFAAHKILTALWPGMADFLAGLLSEDPESRPSAAEVATTLGQFWSDVPDASMVAEMTSLVRNFSAFVADGASPQTPNPVSVESPRLSLPSPVPRTATTELPAPTVVAASPVIPPEAKATSTSGSFMAMPDGPTRMATDSSYANALFEALGDPPPPARAPVEAMAAEIQAADLVSSISLDGLPPPPASDEPMTLGSGEVMVDDAAPAAASAVSTSVEPVPIPEAADWGAQALAALASEAGVEIPATQSSLPAATAMLAVDVTEALPLPPSDPGIEEAFAAAPAASIGAPEPAHSLPADDGKRTLLFAAADPSVANLEDELVDEHTEHGAAPALVSPVHAGTRLVAQAFEPDETVPLAAQAFASAASTVPPEDAFEPPVDTSLALDRAPDGDVNGGVFDADSEPPLSAAQAGEPDGSVAEWSEPRLAHTMSASGEYARKPVTRTAKKTADTMQTQTADRLPVVGLSRARKLGFGVAAALALVGAAAAVVTYGPQLRTRGQLPAIAKPAASSTIKPTPAAKPAAPTATSVATKPASTTHAKASAASTSAPTHAPATTAAALPAPAPTAASSPAPTPSSANGGTISLPVTSEPAGAAVWIDGEERGKTPCTLKLKPGSSSVLLIRAGYRISQSTVDVSDGAKVDVTLKAVEPPMSGDARFRAECATQGKLPIVVDGNETGILCPFSKMRVAPGVHTIGLLIPATGKIHSKEITLSPGVRSITFGD